MPTSLVPNDILSVRCWNHNSEQAAVTSFNFQVIAVTGGAVTDQDVAFALDNTMATFFKGLMPSSCNHDGLQVYFLRSASPFLPHPVKSILQAGPGTKGTTSVPRNSAAILKYSTLLRGPGGRGRVFLPFASIDWLTVLGLPDAAYAVFVNSFASSILPVATVTNGSSSAQIVWSLVTRHPKPAPPTAFQIMEAEAVNKFGQMHKRGDYGRANASPI